MFNLPLSKTLDVGTIRDGDKVVLRFQPYDGLRVGLSLTSDEALALIELLTENKEKIFEYLKSPDPTAK